MVVAGGVALALAAPALRAAWQWNWANVALIGAQGAGEPAALYAWSGAAIAGYAAQPAAPAAQERLLRAYQLRWRGGAQAGEAAAALAAYSAGHELAGDLTPPGSGAGSGEPFACAPGTVAVGEAVGEAAILEAEAFAGVTPGTLSVPAAIGAQAGVLLFSTQPITQTLCAAAGLYTVEVTAAPSGPGPVQLRVEWDGWPAGVLTYEGGEGVLSREELRVATPAGEHTLGLVFANDFADPAAGIDRNALVDAVTITREGGADARPQ